MCFKHKSIKKKVNYTQFSDFITNSSVCLAIGRSCCLQYKHRHLFKPKTSAVFTSLVLYTKYTRFQGPEACLTIFKSFPHHIKAFQHCRFMLYSSADFRHNLPWLNGQMQMCSACAGCWWIPTRNRLNGHISLLLLSDREYCFQSRFWDWMISHPPALVCRAVNKSQRRPACLQTSHSAEKPGERFQMSQY